MDNGQDGTNAPRAADKAAASGRAPGGRCKVMLVDDDEMTRDVYADIAGMLGYATLVAADAPTALRLLAEDPAIGIVVTDVQMPAMDGLSLLDEIMMRFAANRPLVTIVSTGFASMDVAVQAMRFNAMDFLTKPVSAQDFSEALRRASGRWSQLAMRDALDAMIRGSDPVLPPAHSAAAGAAPASVDDLLALAKGIKRSRDRRAAFFDAALFADPCWDIMLDLVCARLEDQTVPVSSACMATGLPFSTALRHVRQLVDLGLVRRWKDPKDRRRDLLMLEDATFETMKNYLVETHKRLS